MPGPLPKPAELRQRRNKSASLTTLVADVEARDKKPRLPACPNGGGWHAMAKRWWADVWESPMHYEFLRGDEPALFRLVVMVDQYWKTLNLAVAREIRLMEREFGLTPLARRRLEWSVVQAEEAKDRREVGRSKRATIVEGKDPRKVLVSG